MYTLHRNEMNFFRHKNCTFIRVTFTIEIKEEQEKEIELHVFFLSFESVYSTMVSGQVVVLIQIVYSDKDPQVDSCDMMSQQQGFKDFGYLSLVWSFIDVTAVKAEIVITT